MRLARTGPRQCRPRARRQLVMAVHQRAVDVNGEQAVHGDKGLRTCRPVSFAAEKPKHEPNKYAIEPEHRQRVVIIARVQIYTTSNGLSISAMDLPVASE